VYAQVYRYRRVSGPVERQQTKWVLFGVSLWFLWILLSSPSYWLVQNLPPGALLPWWRPILGLLWWLSLNLLPMSLAVAVLRYRLFEVGVFQMS
jgi:hypothetical protein